MGFMNFSALPVLAKLFGLVKAPTFIWVAAIGLLIITLGFLARLWWLVYRERRLYQGLTRYLHDLRSEYSPVLRNGLPQAAYEAIIQRFEETPIASVWDGFAAQLVARCDATGDNRFWTSESAATVFNEASVLEVRLNRNFFTAIPGMVTGVGLLCTFVAILLALRDVTFDNNQVKGLEPLISGLSGKFLSSIAALLASTIFLFFEKRFFHSFTRSFHDLVAALDALVPRLTPARLLTNVERHMEELSAAFRHFNSDLSIRLKQGVEEGMGPTRDRMVGALEELNQLIRATEAQQSEAITGSLNGLLQNLGQSLTTTLASMSDRFAQSLSGSANQEFDQVVNTLGGTARLLEGMNAQFQTTQATLTDLVRLAKDTTVEQMTLGKTQVEELTTVLRGLMTQMHDATGTSVNHITTTLTAVVHDLSTRVAELGQQMSQAVTASAGQATGAARAVIEKADQWSSRSAEQLAQLLEKHQSHFDRVQDVQRILDTTLAQFRQTLTEYTAVMMNLSQIATQTSAMVTSAMGATHAIKQAGEATERTAQLAISQVESFQAVVGNMQRYEEIFRQVEVASEKLLGQIEQHLHNYAQVTQQGFDHLTHTADTHFANASRRLGETVNDLDEHLQDLTEILERFSSVGGRNGRRQ
jgi:hypothetical protein